MVSVEYLLKFIQEDAPFGDITSETIIPDTECRALISVEQTVCSCWPRRSVNAFPVF